MNRVAIRTTLSAVLACGVVLGVGAAASAGPVKHWAALPGREIRSVALRGGVLSQPLRAVVAGDDGWVYVRAGNAIYRLTGTGGDTTPAAAFDWCNWNDASAIVPLRAPGIACVAKNTIIEVANGVQYRHRLPKPTWKERPDDPNVYVEPSLVTWIERAPSGRWWFAYGNERGLGYVDPGGTPHLFRVPGMPRTWSAAALGEDVFVGGDGCEVSRIRGFVLRGHEWLCRGMGLVRVARTGDAAWVLFKGGAERRSPGGRVVRWMLGDLSARDVAYDARTRTSYVLALEGMISRAALITIGPDDVPHLTRLPVAAADSIAVDKRGRIWLSVGYIHSLAVIAPAGAWGP